MNEARAKLLGTPSMSRNRFIRIIRRIDRGGTSKIKLGLLSGKWDGTILTGMRE